MILDYLSGESMKEFTTNNSNSTVTLQQMWKWSRQLVSALYTCHEQ